MNLSSKTIAVIGVGAIGSKTALLISKANAKLVIVDRDIVEEKNLSYQKLYSKDDIEKPKADVAAKKLNGKGISEDLTFENINILKNSDIVLDCTDNMETRFLINDYCVKNKKPWIYAAGIKNLGTTMNFLPKKVCFRCIFEGALGDASCETAGITNSTIKNVSTTQVENAKKILRGTKVNTNMIRFVDDKKEEINTQKNPNCKACKAKYEYLEGEILTKAVKLCGSQMYQIKGPKRKSFEKINEKVSVFKDGRALIKAESEKKARSLYSKFIGN